MKNNFIISITILCLAGTVLFSSGNKYEHLAPKYRQWLEKEVNYIITPDEKRVFYLLKTDREREVFIKMFWDHRDPDEHTSENEFMEEHYRRLEYANHHFGKGTPTPGWRTEMGRVYIILGEPNQIQRYENMTEVYPVVIWFYQGMQKYGLPDAFNVVFFKQYGAGDYELYSPSKHGPSSLMVHYLGDTNDYLSQYMKLKEIQKEIADVSLTLIEGESNNVIRPSISSDILIHKKISEMPSKKIDDDYASKLLTYKEFITMEHSAKYISSESKIKIIWDNDGHSIVNYIVEPKKLSMVQKEGQLSTDLLINGSVLDKKDNVIFNFEKIVPVRLNESQANSAKSMLFAFEDSFPLIPGDFKLNLLLRNRLSGEFTSFEKTVLIQKTGSVKLGDLILGNRILKNLKHGDINKPFTNNRTRISISPRNDFTPGQILYLYFQILNSGFSEKVYRIEYTVSGDRGGKLTGKRVLGNERNKNNILEEIPLKGLRADYYTLQVVLFDEVNQIIDSKSEEFYISPNIYLKRPWVVSQNRDQWENEKKSILGIQYSNIKDYKNATIYLRKAYFNNPSIIGTALNYCSVLFKVKNHDEIISIGSSFSGHPEKHKFYPLMAFASHALKKYESAIDYYKKYISYYGENIHILRSLEQCYQKSGDQQSATKIKLRLDTLLSGGVGSTNE